VERIDRHTVEFSCAVVVTGVLAGLAGIASELLLHSVEHLAYHYSFGPLLGGVKGSGPWRRAAAPAVGGALAGLGWWLLRRKADDVPALDDALEARRRLPRGVLALDAGLQSLLVGSGASLGRETAPRQLAAAFSDVAISRWTLRAEDRKILLACAAGAGLGAVYSVPTGGAFFAARVLLGTWHPRAVGTALITSALAVVVASPVTHLEHPLHWPGAHRSVEFLGVALVIAPVAVAVGMIFNKVMSLARSRRLFRSAAIIPLIAAAGLLTGICSIGWPELPGNGRSILTVSLNSSLTIGSAAMILILKPLLTAVFLRVGAVGGLLTPALATGAATGSLITLTFNQLTASDVSVAVVSLTCAAGVLAITQRAPTFATLFVWELARPPWWLILVFATAAWGAHGLRRLRERQLTEAS
jgi:H+/Cl- antiporter ClcA